MVVFVVERHDLVTHNARIAALAAERGRGTSGDGTGMRATVPADGPDSLF